MDGEGIVIIEAIGKQLKDSQFSMLAVLDLEMEYGCKDRQNFQQKFIADLPVVLVNPTNLSQILGDIQFQKRCMKIPLIYCTNIIYHN